MKLNQAPSLRVEDFPSEQSWISKLFVQLNPFIQAVNQLFDNQIDYATNIKSVTRTYTITSFQAFDFSWPFPDQAPQDVKILKALKGVQKTPTILLAAWTFDAAQKLIQVTSMVEVSSSGVASLSGRYEFVVRVNI